MLSSPARLRWAAMPLAALLLHELRYQLTCGSGSSCAQGQGWLSVAIVAGIAVLAVLAARIVTAGLRRSGPAGGWLLAAGALLALHGAQTGLEQLLLAPAGAGLLAAGGWVALPLALLASLLVVLAVRVAAAAVGRLRGRRARPARCAPPGARLTARPQPAPRWLISAVRVQRGPPSFVLAAPRG